jgi:hypothetical protein
VQCNGDAIARKGGSHGGLIADTPRPDTSILHITVWNRRNRERTIGTGLCTRELLMKRQEIRAQ